MADPESTACQRTAQTTPSAAWNRRRTTDHLHKIQPIDWSVLCKRLPCKCHATSFCKESNGKQHRESRSRKSPTSGITHGNHIHPRPGDRRSSVRTRPSKGHIRVIEDSTGRTIGGTRSFNSCKTRPDVSTPQKLTPRKPCVIAIATWVGRHTAQP